MKLLRAGAGTPTEDEAKQLQAEVQNRPPDPNTQYLLAAAEQAKAKAELAQADVALTAARVGEIKAQTAETLAGVDTAGKKAAVDTLKQLTDIAKTHHDMAMDQHGKAVDWAKLDLAANPPGPTKPPGASQ
jgi:hypothetical protein